MDGSVTLVERNGVRVHSYAAPESSLRVTTQLIETPSRLIAVDGQYTTADADEVVAYAHRLGKPIDRLVVSHAHPDHYNGAARFGAPIHALAAVRDQIASQGDRETLSGEVIPVEAVVPTVSIQPGVEVIDGIPFRFDAVAGGETTDQLVIHLPEHGILIAQDLIYNRLHMFIGNDDIARWRTLLAAWDSDTSIELVLPGHGLPAGHGVFAEQIGYLDNAAALRDSDGATYRAGMIERYPDWTGAAIIDIANIYLHGAAQ